MSILSIVMTMGVDPSPKVKDVTFHKLQDAILGEGIFGDGVTPFEKKRELECVYIEQTVLYLVKIYLLKYRVTFAVYVSLFAYYT